MSRVHRLIRAPVHRVALAALMMLAAAAVGGQQNAGNAPRVAFVYPAGGRQGTSVQVTIGGQFPGGANVVTMSGEGLVARVTSVDRPLTQQQIGTLREKIQASQKQPGTIAPDELAAIRDRIADSVQRNLNPSMADRAHVEIDIAPAAEPGRRTLRLGTPQGLSIPLAFDVERLPEIVEGEETSGEPEMRVALPVVINGALVPRAAGGARPAARGPNQQREGDVDRYTFDARRGQSLVAVVRARELQPFIADAVPGWMQAVLTLRDDDGRIVAYADDNAFRPDPVLHYQVTRDCAYTLEIRDALYRGREDFVYRLIVGELPYVTSVFPLGGAAGSRTNVEVTGWNLPSNRAVFDAARARPGTRAWFPFGPSSFNELAMAVGDLPETTEREPNDTIATATSVSAPRLVNGRVQDARDTDVFRVRGRAGGQVAIETSARSLGSPLDTVVELLDRRGSVVARSDDAETPKWGTVTHQSDSRLLATFPADDDYFVRIADVAGKGGQEYAYRLRISAPRPDFDVRVAPSAINASQGGTVPLTLSVSRTDGFAGDIEIVLKDPRPGMFLSGGLVPAGRSEIRATLTLPPMAPGAPLPIRVEGRAAIGGRPVAHEATPADIRMQAFAFQHFVPAGELVVAGAGRGALRVPMRIRTPLPLRIPPNGVATIVITLPPAYRAIENVSFELSEPPGGVSARLAALSGDTATIEIRAAGATPGLRGNLILGVTGERPAPAGATVPAARRRAALGFVPAVPFEVLSPHAAER